MRDTRHFSFIPLSPVHVGTGNTIAPEEYIQDNEHLIRVSLPSVLRGLSAEDRAKLETALERSDLKYTRSLLQAKARDPKHHLYRIPIGKASREDLRDLFHNPERPRTGEVHLLPRNPYSGQPYLPGSSIKGAMRTALLNHAVHHGAAAKKKSIVTEVLSTFDRSSGRPDAKNSARLLEELAFERRNAETEWDPLRALSVSDVGFQAEDARLDRVFVKYRSGDDQQASGIQMHYERLRCQADGGIGTPGTVAITIDVDAIRTLPQMKSRRLWPMLRDGDDPWAYLQLACNTFYGGRFQAEWSDFAFLRSQAQGGPHWGISSWDGVWLLRVGRFSHFDSLSVDELRRGWNAQKRMVLEGLGATRTLCQLADGRRMAPMGWVLLKPLPKSAGTPPGNGAKPA